MAERKQIPIFESCYRIAEYLKKNTDKEHPTTQAAMRKDLKVADFLGAKETSNSYINQIALALNTKGDGTMSKEKDWKIVFDAFTEVHGSRKKSKNATEYTNIEKLPIRNLYYNQEFSYEEIDKIIECISLSDNIDEKTAKKLIKKIKEELTTVFYEEKASSISKIENKLIVDSEYYRKNIKTIEEAIENRVKITFYYNGIDSEKKLERESLSKEIISPYYLVADKGKYYVVACKDSFMGKNYKKVMSIWRVDLMTEVRVQGKTNELPGDPVTKKEEVKNLPLKWSDDFHFSHLNMASDEPVEVTIKLLELPRVDDISRSDKYSHTFLFDTFGPRYTYKETSSGDEIVTVECSPSEMVNWALRYSDRVEVLKPEFLRHDIKERVRALSKTYMNQGDK
ncbi:MAG: WYL domain-containing protein [Clostridia bacterium]|nr:WYL domain-containing protein [Clostridia bacterium]